MLRPYCKLASERLTNSLRVSLLRSKVHVARRLKIVTDPARRDFFNSPRARKHRNEPVNEQSKIMHTGESYPLSKYEEINDKYEEVQYSSKKYNKETRESIKFKLEETFEAMAVRELQHPDTILSPEADKRNRINAAEYEKFRLEFYRKNELSRLIKKAQKHQQVGLYGPGYQDNSNFVSELLTKVKILEDQRHHTGNHPRIEDVRISEMANYQAELKHLKNDRIDGLLGLHNSNNKLKELMEHGFMDRTKPIGEVFELLQEAKQKKLIEGKRNPFLAATASVLGLSQSKEVLLQPIEEQNETQQLSETGVSNQDPQNSQMGFIQREIQDKYKMLVGDDPNKQSAMEMVLRSMEERGLRGSNQSNYFGLVEFVQDFMEMDQQDKADLLERVSRVRQVREFEERVLRERETFMLEGRGTATFEAIKPEERVQFVKHNVNLYQDVFQLVKSHEQAVKTDPAFAGALLEKLAMGWTLAPLYYKNSDYVDLHMIAKPEYMTLMKQVKNNLAGYGFHEFARIVFGFGRIHSREMGQLTAGLFASLTRKVVLVTADHLDRYLEIDRSTLTRDQESAMFYNLGILLEGLTTLGCVNATAPEQLFHKILAVLGRGIGTVAEGCTMNRILAFLIQTRKAKGYSMDKVVSQVAQAAIKHFADSGLHLRLARPEQIDLAHALIGINNFASLVNECRGELNTLVVSLREDIVKNKEKHQMITLADSSMMLVLLQATNQLDIPAKNAIKLKFRDELALSPTLMSYVVPRTMECLAVAELKDANEFYSEYSRPVELLYMKSLFGIRASEFDRTPRFEVYRDMYKFVANYADKLDKKELMSVIDALCVIELPVEIFNFSLLEKTVEELLEGKGPKQNQTPAKPTQQPLFDTQLSSRMALLYSILGVQNLKNKWLRLTLEAIQSGIKFKPDAALEVILCYDLTSDTGSDASESEILAGLFYQNLDLLVTELLRYSKSMTESKKILIAWKLSQLKNVQKEVIDSLLCNLDLGSLKILDKVLLSQIPGATKVVGLLDEAEISKFYESIFFKSSHLVENDVNAMYWKLVGSLKESQIPYKEKVVLKDKDVYHFIPLYLPQKRESLMLYSEDLFLRQLEMSQTRDQGFAYRMTKSDKVPPFFERNEALLKSLDLKVERMSSTTAKVKFTVQNSDLELAGYDELSAKKRLDYARTEPKVAQIEPNPTQNTKKADKPASAAQKSSRKSTSAESKRKPRQKQQEQPTQQTPN